jgi:hypothetical protein
MELGHKREQQIGQTHLIFMVEKLYTVGENGKKW